MKTAFFRIECLTNLYVGAGDVNYNIVDNEVEKDPITGFPMIHASGVKGALRNTVSDEETRAQIFGAAGGDTFSRPGSHKFFDAHLLARPMRVANSAAVASIPVVTVASVNQFLRFLTMFGCNPYGINAVTVPHFGEYDFLTNAEVALEVEGEPTGRLSGETCEQLLALRDVIGDTFALAKSFDGYDLPVLARNHLSNGRLANLWYEEIVPRGSIFYFAVMVPDDVTIFDIPELVQFGGRASIGCGYTRVTKLGREDCE